MKRRNFLGASAASVLAMVAKDLSVTMPWRRGTTGELHTHPRILLHDFEPVRERIGGSDRVAEWYEKTLTEANEILEQPVSEYVIPDGKRLLATSRETLTRVHALGLTYGVDGGPRYLERLWQEIEAVCAFPDWNHHRHFLDTGEMTHAVALAYDWFYQEWTVEQRSTMEGAIIEFGLEPGSEVYAGRGIGAVTDWHLRTNNWNIVCNGGLVVGALAVAEIAPDLATSVIESALETVEVAVAQYAPDGGYPEGIGEYWGYATKYLVLMIEALRTATGDARGLPDSEGLDSTGMFPLYLSGPQGNFNYYDAATGTVDPPEMIWLAREYQQPVVGWWGALGADEKKLSWKQSPLPLLWYEEGHDESPIAADTEREGYFRRCEVASMRSAWESGTALYLAAKAGDNSTNHADLDLGTFIVDALGVRWAIDLGSDDYNLTDYFQDGPDGARWTYYRKRAEGHNTLIIDPAMSADQRPAGAGTIVARDSGPTAAYAIADMAEAHRRINAWRRGWRLFDHRRQMVVQDEIEVDDESTVWWFLHTTADIAIGDDGRSAVLSQSGQRMLARVLSPTDASFVSTDARPLWTSPDPTGQNQNNGVRKLAMQLQVESSATITVQLTPLHDGESAPRAERVAPLSRWSVGPAEVATLASLEVDGEPVSTFASTTFTYELPLTSTAVVSARPGSPRGLARVLPWRPGQPRRVLAIEPGLGRTTYEIWPHRKVGLGNFPEPVIASSDDGNLPTNTVDGDMATRWSAEGPEEWIAYDLAEDGPVSEVAIAWFSGDERQTTFEIEVAAADDASWRSVFNGVSSGESSEPEVYSFDPSTARYLRILCHGNTVNQWNSITEVSITGRSVELPVEEVVIDRVAITTSAVEIGSTVDATVEVARSDGSAAETSEYTLTFESSSPDVATVSAGGQITGVAEGGSRIAAIVTSHDRRLVHSHTEIHVTAPGVRRLDSIADTYVNDGDKSSVNYGDRQWMMVKVAPRENFNRIGYLKFDAAAVPKEEIESVVLHLHAQIRDSNGTEYTMSVASMGEDFDEMTVTWQTRPEPGEMIGHSLINSEWAWYSFDVTSAVRDMLTAGGSIGFALIQELEPGSDDGLATLVSTRESVTTPYLEVLLA